MKQSIDCDIQVASIEYWKGKDLWLEANETYMLTIDYPFNISTDFPVKTGKNGLGLFGLLPHISKAYDKKYAAIDSGKNKEDGYWHGIGDLKIEGIDVDHSKKTIKLHVGS